MPISITEFWETFYADDSLFSSTESSPSVGTYKDFTSWFTPTEEEFKTFYNTAVEQQRDVNVDFSDEPNPIYSRGSAVNHYLLLQKTET